MLSESDSDNESVYQLTINEHYAKAYARKKEREELSKLKENYGSDVEEVFEETEDSEEDTTEDEEGEELTPAMDVAILRMLARIKRKDPAIYDASKDVFEEEQQKVASVAPSTSDKKKEESKPLLLKEHVLNSMLHSSRSPSPGPTVPTHVEEQAVLRKETITAFHTAVSDGEESEDEDDLLIPREKTKDEIEREEEEYREFLRTQVGQDIGELVTVEVGAPSDAWDDEAQAEGSPEKMLQGEKKGKKGKDGKSKEEEDHEFLMDYILNRGWIDRSAKRIPTYNEVTGSKSKNSKSSKVDIIGGSEIENESEEGSDNSADADEEDEFDELAENFESSYNFRFEETDAAQIPTHPRNIASTVRREENPRKAARERKKARKEEKLSQKKEEVKRLKALKMKEIREKLQRIGREGGINADDEALAQLDLEGDWNPDAHDQQMAGIYGNEGGGDDSEKPTWDDDIDIMDIVPPESDSVKKKKKKDKKKDKEDNYADGIDVDVMDADVLEAESSKGKKRKLPDEDLDELYALDFNSMVGDMPTRFRYIPVLSQTYGLSPTEILLTDDKDLNEYVGLRKIAAPYRKDKGRTWDSQRAEKLSDLRKKLSERSGKASEVSSSSEVKKKRKGKKERQKAKLVAAMTEAKQDDGSRSNVLSAGDDDNGASTEETRSSKKRKRKHKKSSNAVEAN